MRDRCPCYCFLNMGSIAKARPRPGSGSWFSVFLAILLQERGPLPETKLGSCLTLRSELSEETHLLTNQEILLGKGARAERRGVREPRKTALSNGSQSRALWSWD